MTSHDTSQSSNHPAGIPILVSLLQSPWQRPDVGESVRFSNSVQHPAIPSSDAAQYDHTAHSGNFSVEMACLCYQEIF